MSEMRRLAIVAAMPEELHALLEAMPDRRPVERAGRTFWLGHWCGQEVVAVLSRIGKVAAATTTTVLLCEFAVDRVLFTGVAGGLGLDVRVGDVVVADQLVQHDMDARPLFPRFELPGTGHTAMAADPDWCAAIVACAERALSPEALSAGGALADVHLSALGLRAPRVHRGLIVSGDVFVSTTVASEALRAALPGALAVEMEGAAVVPEPEALSLAAAGLGVVGLSARRKKSG